MIFSLKQTTVLLMLATALTAGCSSQQPKPVQKHTTHKKSSYTQSGKASYYASKFQGRKTASGQRYDQNAKTAAHRSLPFGTKVKVTNVSNGKSVVVRINDRGPFVKGRIIDLSRSAFASIGNPRAGVISVKIAVLN